MTALEKYVAAGGGVAFFLGDRCDVKFFNDILYRNGKGLFPVPLTHQAELDGRSARTGARSSGRASTSSFAVSPAS